MAMQLDLREWVEEENCAIQRTERTKKEREIKQALLEDQQRNFAKPLLYGVQGEHTNHSSPTFSDTKTPDGHAGSQSKASKGHPGARKPQASRGETTKTRSRMTTKAHSRKRGM
jgi:hypothetical protein